MPKEDTFSLFVFPNYAGDVPLIRIRPALISEFSAVTMTGDRATLSKTLHFSHLDSFSQFEHEESTCPLVCFPAATTRFALPVSVSRPPKHFCFPDIENRDQLACLQRAS